MNLKNVNQNKKNDAQITNKTIQLHIKAVKHSSKPKKLKESAVLIKLVILKPQKYTKISLGEKNKKVNNGIAQINKPNEKEKSKVTSNTNEPDDEWKSNVI